VNFTNPVNLIPAAVGLILGAGNYTLSFDHGNIAFSGIATGAFGAMRGTAEELGDILEPLDEEDWEALG